MTNFETKATANEDQSLEKWKPSLTTNAELYDALEKAFDYRGDVTITLKNASQVVGYVFNRRTDVVEPFIEVIPTNENCHVRIDYKDVAELFFSGQDMAAGRSFAAFMARHKANILRTAENPAFLPSNTTLALLARCANN
ncbi:MAG: hypothetical protein V1899_06770 [Planctomycetota bacterium]